MFRYKYLTFQTQIYLHKQYIFDTNIIQSEYALLFPFSIYIFHTVFSLYYVSNVPTRDNLHRVAAPATPPELKKINAIGMTHDSDFLNAGIEAVLVIIFSVATQMYNECLHRYFTISTVSCSLAVIRRTFPQNKSLMQQPTPSFQQTVMVHNPSYHMFSLLSVIFCVVCQNDEYLSTYLRRFRFQTITIHYKCTWM